MTGIRDLQALFTGTQNAGGADPVTSSRQPRTQSATLLSDQALTGVDKSVVSFTGGSLLASLSQSDVRTDKVAKLQSAIANGTYNVPSSAVAQSIITSLLAGPVTGRS